MIEFKKLEYAHELCKEYAKQEQCRTELKYEAVIGSINDSYVIKFNTGDSVIQYYSIDSLIADLEKLTQPKPKYKAGDECWILNDECEVNCFIIQKVVGNKCHINDQCYMYEENIYPSKSALILAQLKYWSEEYMKHGCTKSKDCDNEYEPGYCAHSGVKLDCKHEDDGAACLSNPPQYKCKKCGANYK